MDREATAKQMKALRTKAKAARKAGKSAAARSFAAGVARLNRQLKASAPRGSARHHLKKDGEGADAAKA